MHSCMYKVSVKSQCAFCVCLTLLFFLCRHVFADVLHRGGSFRICAVHLVYIYIYIYVYLIGKFCCGPEAASLSVLELFLIIETRTITRIM